MFKTSFLASASALCLGLLMTVGVASHADAAANCIKGDRKAPYTIGWANIYSVPTWMKQTQGTIESEVEELKKKGLVDKLVVTDAQGDA
ncbi:ABC transporter substrate-binding protein, partial [Rhizobiaceae sp. 2RAB30]